MFSVIIPLYNKEDTIANTLKSVLQQTFERFEVIVVDDGSTDLSLSIALSFIEKQVVVYSKKHEGVSEARNFGIEKAQYEYIAFLDADDFWEPNYLEEMARMVRKYPDCAMYGSAYQVIGKTKNTIKCTNVPEGVIPDFFAERQHNHIMRTSATVVLKDALIAVGRFPKGMVGGEDDYTWSKIAIKYPIAFTPLLLACYDNLYSSHKLRSGKMDDCQQSWFDLYEEGNFYRNEFIALKAISAGIRYVFGAPQKKSRVIEEKTRFTILSKRSWKYLYLLNRSPRFIVFLIKVLLPFYKELKFSCIRNLRIAKSHVVKTIRQNRKKLRVSLN